MDHIANRLLLHGSVGLEDDVVSEGGVGGHSARVVHDALALAGQVLHQDKGGPAAIAGGWVDHVGHGVFIEPLHLAGSLAGAVGGLGLGVVDIAQNCITSSFLSS